MVWDDPRTVKDDSDTNRGEFETVGDRAETVLDDYMTVVYGSLMMRDGSKSLYDDQGLRRGGRGRFWHS